jgi:hypothetical protein
MLGSMVQTGCFSVSVGVAPAVHTATVLPPAMSAAAAAFRSSTRVSGVNFLNYIKGFFKVSVHHQLLVLEIIGFYIGL